MLEQDTKALSSSIGNYHLKLDAILKEQAEMTEWRIRTEEQMIARREQVDDRITRAETVLNGIGENWKKVSFIVLTAVIGAVVVFLLKGGLFK